MDAETIANALGKFSRNHNGYMAQCPAHDDENPSLSITDTEEGKVLVHCFAGCSKEAVVSALKERSLWPNKPETTMNVRQKVTGRYVYCDAEGTPFHTKERLEPGRNGQKKEFRFSHEGQDGRQIFKRRDEIKLLYNLPDVIRSKSVNINEGEKQCDLLKSWGLVGTTLDSGANSKLTSEQIIQLTGKQIAILRDNDQKGLTYAMNLANALWGKCESLKIVLLPGLPEKGDVCDWAMEPVNDKAKLLEIIKATPEWEPEEKPAGSNRKSEVVPSRIRAVSVMDFMEMKFPPRQNILDPWLPQQGLTMIYAPRGIGKTHVALGIGFAASTGGEFLGWKAFSPKGVLLLDGEMPASVLQERLARIAVSSDKEPTAPFKIVTPDLQSNGMIDLSRDEDQEELEKQMEGIDLIIVDNISTLCRTGKENEGDSWLPVQRWALKQRAAGRSVLFIHHAGKNGAQRGTSRREDVLDTVISLRRPGDYTPDKGACFEVHFEKSRGIFGDDTKPIEAQLVVTPDGRQAWAIKPLEESNVEKVARLLNDGIPQHEIAELIGVSKGTVSKLKKKAAESRLLKVAA